MGFATNRMFTQLGAPFQKVANAMKPKPQPDPKATPKPVNSGYVTQDAERQRLAAKAAAERARTLGKPPPKR